MPTVRVMDKEKAEFAQRLRVALADAGIEPSASLLEKRFNSRYDGAPVSAQAISGWLSGRYMPKQDKIRVLAGIVGMDPQMLQYGGKSRAAEPLRAWDVMSEADSAMLDAFLALTSAQRRLVRELVSELAGTRRR